ncbi:MAG: uracil-DNA glycosylase [Burkholderiales bacterium]|jgi:DNA polymerase|nr:uracil-DNA glycosylase [Burkholderiales bacterium]
MQNRDPYKLLYNNLWLYKFDRTATNSEIRGNKPDATIYMEASVSVAAKTLNPTNQTNFISSGNLIDNWDTLVENISNCTKCGLCKDRKNVVIERGSRSAKWMFVGEGPGEQEDIQGKPFVGASGQLLQKMIAAMNLNPATDVYICNVVKCRPPYNRNPEPSEIEVCRNYLFSQIELVKPQVIITLGRFAHQTLLNTTEAVGRLRLKQHVYQGIPLVVTYHPAYLLRNPSAKKDAWADLQLAMKVFQEKAI